MKNIIKIFLSDIKGLAKNFFALVIAIGLCIIPCLYAWFNIYSNWDPYANTSSIKIAVASEDKDYTLEDGSVVNMGEEVINQLKENDSMGWVITSKKAALDGVQRGSYYAAVVIGKDFTSGMYNALDSGFVNPSITYYENEKKNAIATKITDTAVSTLNTSINQTFIKVVASTIFAETNELSGDLQDSDGILTLEQKLKDMNTSLKEYDSMIDTFIAGNQALTGEVAAANDKIPGLSEEITDTAIHVTSTNASLNATQATMADFNTNIQSALTKIQTSLDKVSEDMENTGLGNKAKVTAESITKTKEDTETLLTQLNTLKGTLTEIQEEKLENSIPSTIEDKKDQVEQQKQTIIKGTQSALDDANDEAIRDFNKQEETLEEEQILVREDEKEEEQGDNKAQETPNEIELPNKIEQPDEIDIPQIQVPDSMEIKEETKQQIEAVLGTIETLQNGATDIKNALGTVQNAINNQKSEGVASLSAGAGKIGEELKNSIDGDVAGVSQALTTCKQSIENMKGVYTSNLVPEMDNVLNNMSQALANVTNLLNDLNSTLGNIGIIFEGVESTVNGVDDSLLQIQSVIRSVSDKLTEVTDKMDSVGDTQKMQTLLDLLKGDPEVYGEYFAKPVSIETEAVYPVKTYGSAVTPFYTVLALWVGGLLLTALIKVKAEPIGLTNVKTYQLFFGRYLLFFVMGQIQALVTVLGNIYLLHCQILHPGLFWFASAVASFTFTMLIYSLTLAFGDIGKAFVVVIVVIQIAGSGGTYPIEILPDFYQNVYIFFPFPYAIGALRETVAGMYGGAYETYLAELLIFALAGLMIGLVLRLPFVKLIHFMEKRMEDTKMM